jgi:hypothetical protein
MKILYFITFAGWVWFEDLNNWLIFSLTAKPVSSVSSEHFICNSIGYWSFARRGKNGILNLAGVLKIGELCIIHYQ